MAETNGSARVAARRMSCGRDGFDRGRECCRAGLINRLHQSMKDALVLGFILAREGAEALMRPVVDSKMDICE